MCEPYLEHLQEQFLQANKSIRSARLRVFEALTDFNEIDVKRSIGASERQALREDWSMRRRQLKESDIFASRKLAMFATKLFEELDEASVAVRNWNGKTPSELKEIYEEKLCSISSTRSALAAEVRALIQDTVALLSRINAVEDAEDLLSYVASLNAITSKPSDCYLDDFFSADSKVKDEVNAELRNRLDTFERSL